MSTLWDNIKKGLADSAKIAKEGAQAAAEKAEELGKKSKIMIEISNIKRKVEKNFTDLGGKAYHLIQEEKVKNITTNDEVKSLISSIQELEESLNAKQEELDNIGVAFSEEGPVEAEVVVEASENGKDDDKKDSAEDK